MTPSERLKEIERKLNDLEHAYIWFEEDMEWLINREKRLDFALERLQSMRTAYDGSTVGEIARKARESEE